MCVGLSARRTIWKSYFKSGTPEQQLATRGPRGRPAGDGSIYVCSSAHCVEADAGHGEPGNFSQANQKKHFVQESVSLGAEQNFRWDKALETAAALEDEELSRKLSLRKLIIVDVNLLIYAVNRDAPLHRQAKPWLEGVISGTETVGLSWIVVLAFLRLTTPAG